MIAMALANGPEVLIADEPTTALDVTIQAQILELLADLKSRFGMAVVFITHDLGIVRRFADRVVVMKNGDMVETGDHRGGLRRTAPSLYPHAACGRAHGPKGASAEGRAGAARGSRRACRRSRCGAVFRRGATDAACSGRRGPRPAARAAPSASSVNPGQASRRWAGRMLRLVPSSGRSASRTGT